MTTRPQVRGTRSARRAQRICSEGDKERTEIRSATKAGFSISLTQDVFVAHICTYAMHGIINILSLLPGVGERNANKDST